MSLDKFLEIVKEYKISKEKIDKSLKGRIEFIEKFLIESKTSRLAVADADEWAGNCKRIRRKIEIGSRTKCRI